jgi:transmembrane sensor
MLHEARTPTVKAAMSMASSVEIEEEAAAWLVKRQSGQWTAHDQAALDAWLASVPNRVAFIRLEGAWRRAERWKALGAGTRRGAVPEPADWKQSPFFDRRMPQERRDSEAEELGEARDNHENSALSAAHSDSQQLTRLISGSAASIHSSSKRRLVAVAATLLITALGAVAWFLWPAGSDYRTPVGGLASVPMSDGSKVTLNTNSEIHIALTEKERRVALDQGEAFFEVAKDPRRPFVVEAGNRRVIAIGTRFSVRREANDIRVVVTEGQVRVEQKGTRLEPPANLRAGDVARASEAGLMLQKRQLPEVEEALSWRTGYLVFHETVLAEAVAEFNRYNTRKIVIQDPEVAAFKFSGNLRSTNFEGFVRLLEEGFPISARLDGETIVLTKN